MSIKAMGLVYDRTRAKGSNLHALIIIADYAKDDGKWAWPLPSTIARKQRLTPRAGELILRKLVSDGEIRPEWDAHERRLYLHVRCVCEWDAYRAEAPVLDDEDEEKEDREKISRSMSAAFALRLVDLATASAKSRAANAKSRAEQGEVSCAQREISCTQNAASDDEQGTSRSQPLDPSVDPLGTEQGRPPRPSAPDDEDPEENLSVITKLAHEAFDVLGNRADLGDVAEAVKSRCSKLKIKYWPGDVVRRAIDSAKFQRTRLRPEVH